MAVGANGAGAVATVDGPLSNDTIAYSLGRVTRRTLNSVSSSWTYDALGRLARQADPIGTFTYDYAGATGRLQQLAYPNGQTSTYAYLANAGDRRLQEIHHKTSTGATSMKKVRNAGSEMGAAKRRTGLRARDVPRIGDRLVTRDRGRPNRRL